jgi:hypothetical protein
LAKRTVPEEIDFLHTRHGSLLLLLALLDRSKLKSWQTITIESLAELIHFAQNKIAPTWVDFPPPDQKMRSLQTIFFPFLSYSLDAVIVQEELIGDMEMLMTEGWIGYRPLKARSTITVLEKTHSFWANLFSTISLADRVIIVNFANLLVALLQEVR